MSRPSIRLAVALGLSALILIAVAALRGGEYDEYYSVFLIAGHPRPAWPTAPFLASATRSFYHGSASFGRIAEALRHGDVHPPLYFWLVSLWKNAFGTALFGLRLFSILCSVVSLFLIARIARRIGAPPYLAVTITLLCTGFAYTGIVARGFALAGTLSLAGTLFLIDGEARSKPSRSFIGGIAFGAACFTNYLACFTALAMLVWIAIVRWRHKAIWLPAWFGAALFIPAGYWFFSAQYRTRDGQFAPFHPAHAISLLARDQAGAILGGLPRYAPSAGQPAFETALAILLIFLAVLAVGNLPRLAPRYRALLVAGIAAPPFGLLALGCAFDTTPIEMRYLWLGIPFVGLTLANALHYRPKIAALLVAVQFAAILGLAVAQQTMQPGTRTAEAMARSGFADPDSLVLVPFGNDGVGIPGPFIAASPDTMRIMVVRAPGKAVFAAAVSYGRIAIARIAVDGASRKLVPELTALFGASPCWRAEPAPRSLGIFENLCRKPDGKAPEKAVAALRQSLSGR